MSERPSLSPLGTHLHRLVVNSEVVALHCKTLFALHSEGSKVQIRHNSPARLLYGSNLFIVQSVSTVDLDAILLRSSELTGVPRAWTG
jgi:hypothetical protein